MAIPSTKTRESLLGYEITERIGAGGYGEVWKATAPGGLTKAIKFVYGYLDDERARRELKALSRVKQVRHAFLLSLERIEVVDGQLVIVTELADMSLKDRCEQCKAAGLVGIPRDELLGYMHDAADALDYMREKYSLQHLDVKPENLLLVGGHVKVADFGLVKDIGDTRASMMGGLTPVYASPEVFDDRPSHGSDQYSLAIVYQEMLTDTLPFPGKTTAQLAAQHLQSRARLTALPPHDKPIVERALSKDPQRRFADCRTMIDALIAAGRAQTGPAKGAAESGETTPLAEYDTHPARRTSAPSVPSEARRRTQSFGESRTPVNSPAVAPPPPAAPRLSPVTTELPPLAVPASAYLRPALFVSIGGTAIHVLQHVRRRLEDRYGNLENLPAVRLLAVDTDAQTLADATRDDGALVLGAHDVLSLPLKTPDDYRGNSTQLLSWMSRRWLYNIPRSLATEGLRPLGRLALVDNGEILLGALTSAIEAITEPAANTATAEQVGEAFRDNTPRVFLLASIAGGTGGGMALDVAYTLRALLSERGLSPDSLTVLLLHSTGRNPAAHELAVANTHATLTELAHYVAAGYPGEAALRIAPLNPEESQLSNVYLVHLGDELGEPDLAAAAETVADYLYLNAATSVANWFDTARGEGAAELQPADAALAARIRTFGMCDLGYSRTLVSQAVDRLCASVVERWCGERLDRSPLRTPAAASHPPAAKTGTASSATASTATWSKGEIDRLAVERAAMMSLSLDQVLAAFGETIASTLGCDETTFIRTEVTKILESSSAATSTHESDSAEKTALGKAPDETHPLLRQADRLLTEIMPDEEEEGQSESTPWLAAAIETHLMEAVKRDAAAVRAWAVELADQPSARLKGAGRAVDYITRHVRVLRDEAHSMRARTAEQWRSAAAAIASAKPRPRAWPAWGAATHAAQDVQARLEQYTALRLLDLELGGVVKFAQLLAWELTSIVEQFNGAQRALLEIATDLAGAEVLHHPESPRSEAAAAIAAAARDTLERRRPEMVVQLDQDSQTELARLYGGLLPGLTKGSEFVDDVVPMLRRRAQVLILDSLRAAAIGHHVLDQDGEQTHELLRSALAEAMPVLDGCGGARRLLVITSDDASAASLAHSISNVTSHAPSMVVEPTREPALCYEIANVTLADAAASLVENQPHCAQLAARLHTRCDVNWQSLDRGA